MGSIKFVLRPFVLYRNYNFGQFNGMIDKWQDYRVDMCCDSTDAINNFKIVKFEKARERERAKVNGEEKK